MYTDSDPNPLPCLARIAFVIIGIYFLSSSPDWVIAVLLVAIILWQGFVSLRYFAMKTVAGNLLTRIPNHKNLSRVIIVGIIVTIPAILVLIEPSKNFSATRTYSFETFIFAMVIFSIIEVFRYTEIRENGILHETGVFYHWKQIESLDWTDTGDKLSMKLRNSFLKKNVKLAINSSYEKKITDSFAQYAKNNYVG